MTGSGSLVLKPIGVIRSPLKSRENAPRQPREGAPEAWLELDPAYAIGLKDLREGEDIIVITYLHKAERDVLEVRPRRNPDSALVGVFTTRSPDRPNPIGLHRTTVLEISATNIRLGPIEAIDGTPVIDIKPVLKHTVDG